MVLYAVLATLALSIPFPQKYVAPLDMVSIFDSKIEVKEQVGMEKETEIEEIQLREVTEREYSLLCRVCMSEAGGKYGEPKEGKVAVVETILNRVDMGMGTIEEVVTKPYQYSMEDNGEPDETVFEAVDAALSGKMYPETMIYFRMYHYHSFGEPYKKIGCHYFSLEGEGD